MMTSLILGLALAPIQYSFGPTTNIAYDSVVKFEGFIPILGGNEGTVVVEMGVSVTGLEPVASNLRAVNEITRFRVTFNEAPLPLDVSSVQSYFPKTTISVSPQGRIVSSNAPDVKLPVRLPGLDVKRFPDITYVPIEFPKDAPKVGDSWKFTKKFGESDVAYSCKLAAMENGIASVDVSLRQEYELLEDAALEVVTSEKDAERRVKTVMTGNGRVVFDTQTGSVKRADMVNDAVSTATKISDGKTSERKLKTTFTLVRKDSAVGAKTDAKEPGLLQKATGVAQSAFARMREWYALAGLSIKMMLRQIPGFSLGGG